MIEARAEVLSLMDDEGIASAPILDCGGVVFSGFLSFFRALISLDTSRDNQMPISFLLLVLCNKIDLPTACNEDQIRGFFGIQTTGKGKVALSDLNGTRPVEIFMCSVLKKQGYGEGFTWLSQYIT